MKKGLSRTVCLFAAVMLIFSVATAAFVILRSVLDFRLEDTERSLETSHGRERKQQYEYDEVTEQLPQARAELAEAEPKAAEAAETVRMLKEERKRLREEKKALEEARKAAGEAGETSETTERSGVPEVPAEDPEAGETGTEREGAGV